MTILCATDFSPCSTTAVEVAAALAQRLGGGLVLLHAVEPIALPPAEARMSMEPVELQLREAARAKLATMAGKLRQTELAVDARVVRGDAATVTLETARALKPSLIVLGTHGRRGAARLFLGSE